MLNNAEILDITVSILFCNDIIVLFIKNSICFSFKQRKERGDLCVESVFLKKENEM